MVKTRTIRVSKKLYELLDEIAKKIGTSKIKSSEIIANTFINNASLIEINKKKRRKRKIEIKYEFKI